MAQHRTIKAVSDDLIKLECAHYALNTNYWDLSTKHEDLQTNHSDLHTSHKLLRRDVQQNTKDLVEIADYFKWFMKVVIGLVVAAVVSFVIQGGLV